MGTVFAYHDINQYLTYIFTDRPATRKPGRRREGFYLFIYLFIYLLFGFIYQLNLGSNCKKVTEPRVNIPIRVRLMGY